MKLNFKNSQNVTKINISKSFLNIQRLFVFVFLLLVTCCLIFSFNKSTETARAAGNTYYVSNSTLNGYSLGDNANDGLSKLTPKLTIAGAQTSASSGDTVIINDGTYLEGALVITKGLTLNPETDYGVTITTATTLVLNCQIADGSTLTLGKLIIDGGNTSQYGVYYTDKATQYSTVLNQTKIQNTTRHGIYGNVTKLNFTSNQIIIDRPANTGYPAIMFTLATGGVTVNGGTFTGAATGTGRMQAVVVAGAVGVTASVTNTTINTRAGTTGSGNASVISLTNIDNAVVTGNDITITSAAGVAGIIDGITINTTSGGSADNAVVADNVINNSQTGSGGHLITIGQDASDPASVMHNTVNDALVYNNQISGVAGNSGQLHGIMLGNQSGGAVYNNKVDYSYIAYLAKGQTGGSFYNNVATHCGGQALRAKASSGISFLNNTVVLVDGYSNRGIYVTNDVETSIYSSNITYRNNIIFSTVAPYVFAEVEPGNTATFNANNYYGPADSNFVYDTDTYSNLNLWRAAHESDVVSGDPLLVDYANGDYSLQASSSAIDSGYDTSIATDILGNARRDDLLIPNTGTGAVTYYDLGAYEYIDSLAAVPSAPTVSATSPTSLTIVINTNGNSAPVEYAIQNVTENQYLQADGTLGALAVWRTRLAWGGDSGIANSSLSANSSYGYKVKARNGDYTETALSGSAAKYTQANIPSSATVDSRTTTSINWSWSSNSNPVGTNFYASNSAGNSGWSEAVSWSQSTLEPSTDYSLNIIAKNADGIETSPISIAGYTLANVPSAPIAYGGYSTNLGPYVDVTILSNNNPASTWYWIQYSTDNIVFSDPAGMSWQTGSSYRFSNLLANTRYYFRVKAKNGDATETSYSTSGTAITSPEPYIGTITATPTSLVGAIIGTSRNIILYTDSSPDANKKFTVIRSNTNDLNYTFLVSSLIDQSLVNKFEWDFGDGTFAEGPRVEHQYASPGRYIIKLTTNDIYGNKTSQSSSLDVIPPKPTIDSVKLSDGTLVFKGTSWKGAVIRLSIFSDPILVETTTDEQGNWIYELTDSLGDLKNGDHTVVAKSVYVLNDKTELISESSEAYNFKIPFDNINTAQENKFNKAWILVLSLAIILIGLIILKRKKSNKLLLK